MASTRTPRRFLRQARSRVDRNRLVDLRMTHMAAADALWWDRRLGPHHVKNPERADRYWPWSILLPMCHLVQRVHGRHCRPLVIWARADSGRFLRVGMSILIEAYPALNVAAPARSEFLWFLSAADGEVLRAEFGMSHPPALGRVLIDNAIVLSQNAGFDGRTGLHAARAGGEALLEVYRHCGLLQLAGTQALPHGVRAVNDGRFFYTDEAVAEGLARNLDPHR